SFSVSVFAQPWMKLLPKDKQQNPDFYSVRDAFNRYWKPFNVKDGYYYKDGKKIKAVGWKQFHRWEYLMETRVDKTGFVPAHILRQELLKVVENKRNNKSPANWIPLGPVQVPTDIGGSSPRGNGRINTVAFHPTNPNIFWVGAPSGGVWKTTDGGSSWVGVSDDWAVIGISDIAVNPVHPDTVFASTGDADAGDTWSIGILISTDSGLTWNPTGLSTNVTDNFTFRKLAINPDNPSILLASSNKGMYHTTDAGATWNAVMTSTNFKDVELMPGNPQVVYVASKSDGHIYKSTDGGVSYSEITPSALNSSEVARIELAVTPDNPDVIVALCANSSNDNGFHSLWKSSNGGSSWTKLTDASDINLLGWETDGSDSGGQGWYDLSLAVDPQNENTFFVGGVNIWKTTNSGGNWNQVAHWYGGGGAAYVHADQHIFRFNPLNNNLFSGNDGGIYYSTNLGTSWIDVSSGVTVLQIYRMGTAQTDPDISVTGAQDNGSMKRNGTTWNSILGGDGMDCLVDYTDEDILYAEYYYGYIYKSTDGGYNMNAVNLSPAGSGAWITPYIIDWNDHNTLYAGFDEVYKTTDGGNNWNTISSGLTGGTNLQNMTIAPSNSNYLYVSTYNNIWRTSNGGTSWTNITTVLPSESITSIAVSDTDPLKIWVTFSGYSAGEKVYQSTDGGNSWTNFSTGLPNLPTNCIVYENGTSDALYAGTDVGVYYRNTTMTQWQPFNNDLPNVIIDDLEIQYSSGKLRAATYGRSMWESDLYEEAINPDADFSYNTNNVCEGTVDFQDQSTGVPDTWHWDFGDGNTSILQNPSHTYATLGAYTVTEIASNAYGVDTMVQTIILTSQPVVAQFTASQLEFCSAPANVSFTNNSQNALSYIWDFGDGSTISIESPSYSYISPGNYIVTLTANSALCGSDTETVTISIDPSNVITALMPNNTTNSLTCCHGTLYDDGGPSSNYADNNTSLVTISPQNATQISLNFASFDYEVNYDYLYIYNGPDDSSPLVGSYTGSSLPNGGTIDINGSSVTIKHSSDPYVNGTGFELTWSCLTVGEKLLNEGIDFEVYPNPNSGQFFVNFKQVSKEVNLRLVDMSGKVIFDKKINQLGEITISNLFDGLYGLILMTDKQLYYKKIMIIR
ncbi:MAG: PKD domain-containing protein, partial [Bacteroidales bacterium]|nr:PKD domain-containing protein [Bacteroidales bacterium]